MQVASTCASFHYTDLPLATYRADEVVLAAGPRTLLFLREGAVAVVRQGTQIALVDEPGAVFGEISALLDRPHTAEIRALKPSQFYIADASLLRYSAAALFYVAGVLAQRLDHSNQALVVSLRAR
jgi:CRP/FNR family transcriptional regulator, cyclic AMP receptor protein